MHHPLIFIPSCVSARAYPDREPSKQTEIANKPLRNARKEERRSHPLCSASGRRLKPPLSPLFRRSKLNTFHLPLPPCPLTSFYSPSARGHELRGPLQLTLLRPLSRTGNFRGIGFTRKRN